MSVCVCVCVSDMLHNLKLDSKNYDHLHIKKLMLIFIWNRQYRNVIEGAKPTSMSRIPDGMKQDAMGIMGMYDGWDGKQVGLNNQ